MPLREVHWEVTNRCNLRCKHCLPASGSPRPGELSFAEAQSAMDQFEAAGATALYLTGGEPFARPDIWELLASATRRFSVEVISNGTLLHPEALARLQALNVGLGISLEGIGERNDAVRGSGVFAKATAVLSQCQSLGIPTRLYTTVMRGNIGELHRLAALARQYGCAGIHFNDLTLSGRALEHASELRLSEQQQSDAGESAAAAVREAFGVELAGPDTKCWVDGSAVYMTSDGNLYVCSEVFQRDPSLKFGNIRDIDLPAWLAGRFSGPQPPRDCCYGHWAAGGSSFLKIVSEECAYVPQPIGSLEELYGELERLYATIESDCRECRDPDCMGYIWVLRQEAEKLLAHGVPLIRINGRVDLIHSFPESPSGGIDLTQRYPRCGSYCEETGRCLIHENRPLACRLYPLGLETTAEGKVVWAIHEDCLHVRRLRQNGRFQDFEQRAQRLINRLSPELRDEILSAYRGVDEISSFPDGENNYAILKEA